MPLPAGGSKVPWPPQEAQGTYMRYAEHSAWYDGSPLALAAFYGGYGGSQLGGQSLGFFNQNLTYPEPTNLAAPLWRRFMFWSKQPTTPVTRFRIHVPIAADIAARSADLMFSEPPAFTIPEAHLANAASEAKDAQDRLDELIEGSEMVTTLLEAGEVCAALGGVYLRAGWDRAISDLPFITAVHADSAVPEFQWGRLSAVTFWRIVHQEEGKVWRHLERHEPGFILHGLYRGDARHLGQPVPLDDAPETAPIVSPIDDSIPATDNNLPVGNIVRIETGLPNRLTATYIPNMRPNRNDRGSFLGRSDYSGLEGLMDSLDETYSSWMRDIRLGKGRILVASDYLHSEGRGKGAGFDIDREVFQELDVDPTNDSVGITNIQFAIRTQEHAETANELVERIIAGAGYSGSTFGLTNDGPIKTATEIAAREQLSLVTRAKKARYWARPLKEILITLMMLDKKLFNGPDVMEPDIVFSDSVRNDAKETATTVGLLRTATAASTETLVRMVHPDWGDDRVEDEVARILNEKTPAPPAPTVGTPPTLEGVMNADAAANNESDPGTGGVNPSNEMVSEAQQAVALEGGLPSP